MKSKNIKSKALQLGPQSFKTQSLNLGRFQRMNFEQLLDYILKQNKELRFIDFNKNCGISRKQWDIFKAENQDKEVKWIVG